MRRLLIATAAIVTIAAAGIAASPRAEAMTLPGAVAAPNVATENVGLVCRRAWNGYRWVRRCFETGGGYYGGGGGYYGGGYGPPRPRFYRPGPRFYAY